MRGRFIRFLRGKEDVIIGRLAIVVLVDYPYRDMFRIGPHIYRAVTIGKLAFGWEIR